MHRVRHSPLDAALRDERDRLIADSIHEAKQEALRQVPEVRPEDRTARLIWHAGDSLPDMTKAQVRGGSR
jgi:hypothetical protein